LELIDTKLTENDYAFSPTASATALISSAHSSGTEYAPPQQQEEIEEQLEKREQPKLYVICRRGVDSTAAALLLLKEYGVPACSVFNITGGLDAWRKEVDPTFPSY
jgi:rhodanese-related sulfurtransferase